MRVNKSKQSTLLMIFRDSTVMIQTTYQFEANELMKQAFISALIVIRKVHTLEINIKKR